MSGVIDPQIFLFFFVGIAGGYLSDNMSIRLPAIILCFVGAVGYLVMAYSPNLLLVIFGHSVLTGKEIQITYLHIY